MGRRCRSRRRPRSTPRELVDHFGLDAYRYYFLRAIPFGQDGSFSWEHMSAIYTSELANGLGNLASRVTAMVNKYFDGVLPAATEVGPEEERLHALLASTVATAEAAIDDIALHKAVEATEEFVGAVNLYLAQQEPWKVAKDESARGRLATILVTAAEALRAVAVLHHP